MSLRLLSDVELHTKVCEARSFLDGLKRETDSRGWLREGMELAMAADACAEVVTRLRERWLEPWQFLKPDGSTGICSWCEKEHGHAPTELASHGICGRHLQSMRQEVFNRRKTA